jgi:hypothetical protein
MASSLDTSNQQSTFPEGSENESLTETGRAMLPQLKPDVAGQFERILKSGHVLSVAPRIQKGITTMKTRSTIRQKTQFHCAKSATQKDTQEIRNYGERSPPSEWLPQQQQDEHKHIASAVMNYPATICM